LEISNSVLQLGSHNVFVTLLLANIRSEDLSIATISSNPNIAADIIINRLYMRIQSLLKNSFSIFWKLYKNMALLNRISTTLMKLAF